MIGAIIVDHYITMIWNKCKTAASKTNLRKGCADGGGGGASWPMFANIKKVGHAAGTLVLMRKYDQISTCNSFILLIMVGHLL